MANVLRRAPALLGLVALGAVGLLVERAARAEDGEASPRAPETWVLDVRVVRLDPADAGAVEVAPTWQTAGAGATTTAVWADLLKDLKARGRTTILLDQRLTAIGGVPMSFKQTRMLPLVMLRSRADKQELWETSYRETGTKGLIEGMTEAGVKGMRYEIDVTWEEPQSKDGMLPISTTSWKGSHSSLLVNETLVLTHRQQWTAGEAATHGIEIYVLVTARSLPAK
jgi:hypothetical protein